jgi:Fascin domain
MKIPDPVLTTLQTVGGYFVTAEAGGGREVVATRFDAGPWEVWIVRTYEDGRVALQAHDGHYLTAELDGSVRARAIDAGEWERFTYELRDVGVAFLSAHGKYLCAPEGGGGLITCDRPLPDQDPANVPGEWEFFVSSADFWTPPVTNPNLIIGELTRDYRVIHDELGPRILMGCHFMEGFSAYCHGKSVGGLDVPTQLDIIAENYGIVRNLDVLGYWDANRPGDADEWEAWKGREVTPIGFIANSEAYIEPTPDYWDRKREYVTLLHERGLRIFDDRGDMNSWTHQQKLDHMFTNGQFYDALTFGREVLAGVFAINEAWQNGGDDRDLLCDMIRAFEEGAGWLPAIVGLSAPGGSSDPDALAMTDPVMTSWEPEMPDSFVYWSKDPASVITCHGNRGDHTHIVEHYFGYGYDEEIRDTGKPVQNTEPVGGGDGVSVGQVNDPELLCALTAAALLGGQGWTFMSGNGVFWNGPIHTMPGYLEVARLPTFLPPDIASFPVVCHAGTRFQGVRILAAVDPTRAEHAIAEDGRFVIVVHTQEAAGNALPCERACQEFTVINMLTGLVERSGPLAPGASFQHDGVARLVVGRLEPAVAAATMSTWNTAITSGRRRGGRLRRLRRLLGTRGWTA